MEWSTTFEAEIQPTPEQIAAFIANPLWQRMNSLIQERFNVLPTYHYSCCSMQKGWNVKYKKSGKAICTLYPMPGEFIALVVLGKKEIPILEEMEITLSEKIRKQFFETQSFNNQKWMMITINSEQILEDTLQLINTRFPKK